MADPNEYPPVPQREPDTLPGSLPEEMPSIDNPVPEYDPPTNPDQPGFPQNPNLPELPPQPMPMPAM